MILRFPSDRTARTPTSEYSNGTSYPYKRLLLSDLDTTEKSLQDTGTGKFIFFEKTGSDTVQYSALKKTAVMQNHELAHL